MEKTSAAGCRSRIDVYFLEPTRIPHIRTRCPTACTIVKTSTELHFSLTTASPLVAAAGRSAAASIMLSRYVMLQTRLGSS